MWKHKCLNICVSFGCVCVVNDVRYFESIISNDI